MTSTRSTRRKRILTGDRPTAEGFHLGNYVGSLANRVRLQDEYDTFILQADLHLLTTRTANLEEVQRNIRGMALDYLSVGLDPAKCTFYVQSLVPEVLELLWLFMALVSVPRAQRIPTLKEQVRDLKLESASVALLSYPILQAADILMVKGDCVPVGKDQLSHIELTREIARRFNDSFRPVFPIPDGLVGEVPTLPGIDGKAKMSKSLGNAIFLAEDAETVTRKVMRMYTDPTRIHATDPGHVRGNPVFTYLDVFSSDREELENLKRRYRRGKVGDVEVKQRLARALNAFLEPIRERRALYEGRKGFVEEMLLEGTSRARAECQRTLQEARDAMGLSYFRQLRQVEPANGES
jgi:tryptophanyl-tRNA synthetase